MSEDVLDENGYHIGSVEDLKNDEKVQKSTEKKEKVEEEPKKTSKKK